MSKPIEIQRFDAVIKELLNTGKATNLQDIANRLGVQRNTLNFSPTANRKPGPKLRKGLKDVYNINPAYILGKSKDMYIQADIRDDLRRIEQKVDKMLQILADVYNRPA